MTLSRIFRILIIGVGISFWVSAACGNTSEPRLLLCALGTSLFASTYLLRAREKWRMKRFMKTMIVAQREEIAAPSRLEVNSAMEKLISTEEFLEPAQIVINFGFSLSEGNKQFRIHFPSFKKNDSVTGHTNELGNVSVRDEKEEPFWKTFGQPRERVGQFKLWKSAEGHLVFQYFWKADITTQALDGGSEMYGIDYHPFTLEPIRFGRYEIVRRSVNIPGIADFFFDGGRFVPTKKNGKFLPRAATPG